MINFTTQDGMFQERIRDLSLLAKTNIPILLVGETGTGKDWLAQRIHDESRQAKTKCAYARLNSSEDEREVLLHLPLSGTIVFDEISDWTTAQQQRALAAIKPRQETARMLSTTNLDIQALVKSGKFRSDLFGRLAGEVFYLPPLRRRISDIPDLMREFDREYCRLELGAQESPGIEESVINWAMEQPWPGNVRELQFTVIRGRQRAKMRGPITLKSVACKSLEYIIALQQSAKDELAARKRRAKQHFAVEVPPCKCHSAKILCFSVCVGCGQIMKG